MFNRFKRNPADPASQSGAAVSFHPEEASDWEEILPEDELSPDDTSSVPEFVFEETAAPEIRPVIRTDIHSEAAVFNDEVTTVEFDPELGSVDISQFPALRLAFGQAEPDEPDSSPALPPEAEGTDPLDTLIRRYAALADEEEPSVPEEEFPAEQPAPSTEELPALFQGMDIPRPAAPAEEAEAEELPMESLIQQHRDLSGELMDYIDTIKNEAASRSLQRESEQMTAKSKPYDPYNSRFNDRYGDSEESEEPENIPFGTKYNFSGGF